MTSLSTRTEENEVKSLLELYPENPKTLVAAGLVKASQQLPSLVKVLDDRAKNSEAKQLQKEKRKKDRRTTYIVTRFSGNCRYPIHKTLNQLKTKYGMKWLRVRMCWKRHRNLKEILLGDLSNKLLENVEDEIFSDKPCNCRRDKLVDGECFLNGQCRVSNVIYKLHCKCCGDSYLGKTARHTKLRAQEHINKVVEIWKKSETFNRLVAAEIEQTSVASPYLPPTSFQTPNRPTMVTRAMRGAATPPQTARSTPSTQSNAGLIAICQLFASTQPPQTNNQLETLREDEEYSLAETSNPLPSEIVTTNHSMSDEPTSPVEEPTMDPAEQPPTNLFREAFGTPTGNPRSNLQHLEQARPQLFAPVLDGHIKGI